MLLIGESINGSIQKVGQAILKRDKQFIQELARAQYECGAHILDVNAGVVGGNEVQDLPWVVHVIQQEVSLPLMLDSANPEALESALKVYSHFEPPIINSISGEEAKWNKLFPIVAEKKYKIVILLMDDQGIPKTVKGKLNIAKRLYQKLMDAGFPPDYIYFDILVLSTAVEPETVVLTLETIKAIRSNFPKSHTICGISNVSIGLPGRRLINRTFVVMSISAGLHALLVDVRDRPLMSSIYAARVLLNQDPYCLEYLKAYREKKILI